MMERKRSWKKAHKQLESILPKSRKRKQITPIVPGESDPCGSYDNTYLLSEVPIFKSEFNASQICLFSMPENSNFHSEMKDNFEIQGGNCFEELTSNKLSLIPYLEMKILNCSMLSDNSPVEEIKKLKCEFVSPYHAALNNHKESLNIFVYNISIDR